MWSSTPVRAQAAPGDLLGASITNPEVKKALVQAAGLGRHPVMLICLLGPWAAKPLGLGTHKRALVCSDKPQWAGQVLHRGQGVADQSMSVMGLTPAASCHQK